MRPLSDAVPEASPDGLARLSDALSLLTVVYRALCAKELAGTGDEAVAFGYALDMLRAAYNARDRAAPGDPRSV
jgi:hypothetical protein